MKDLLRHIPQPSAHGDRWQGATLPPVYTPLHARAAPAWFVDGGNAEILGAPHFSLQKLRAIAIHYPEKHIIKTETTALLTRAPEQNGVSAWHCRFEDGSEADYAAEEIMDAITSARQRLEHDVAQRALAKGNGRVVLDGDVAPEGTIALQKSITTLTENGFALSSVLTAAGPWSAQLDKTTAVKLHPRAYHVFLVHGANREDIELLAHYSDDALFPGYPGGLVLADKLARVSDEERTALRTHAKAMLRDLRSTVAHAEAATDSHSILDSM